MLQCFLWLLCPPVQQVALPGCLQSQGTWFGDPHSPFFCPLLLFPRCLLQGGGYREVVNASSSLLQPPCIFSCLLKGFGTFRGGRMLQSKGRPCCRGWISLEGKVRTQMEGTECEISALLSAQQPAESSCFHCVKSRPGQGSFQM